MTKGEGVFPIAVLILVALLLPSAAPLGMFCFGNLMKESGVVERLSDASQNALINIVTSFLGLSVGYKMSADAFLNGGTLAMGLVAFMVGTAAGVLMAKIMNALSKDPINPNSSGWCFCGTYGGACVGRLVCLARTSC